MTEMDFSKMTPKFYEEIQKQRNDIELFKKKLALYKLDDDYDEEDDEYILILTEKINEMSEKLKKYEI